MANPTKIEERKAKTKIAKTAIKVCDICWKEEDAITDQNTNTDIVWIECEICGLWVHQSCTNVQQDDTYICCSCLTDYT